MTLRLAFVRAVLEAQVSKRLLALDQSSHITGWAVFENENLLDSGIFEIKGNDFPKRLFKIKLQVLNLIDKYDINEVIFEDIQLQETKITTFKLLAEVIGMLVETFEEIQMPSSTVLAVQWKSTLKIKGRRREEQKANAQKYVLETYGKQVSQDESDAICIGTYKLKHSEEYFDWSE